MEPYEEDYLDQLQRSQKVKYGHQQRSMAVLSYYRLGGNKVLSAKSINKRRGYIYKWVGRWESSAQLRKEWYDSYQKAELSKKEYEKRLESIFNDHFRSGKPAKFTSIEIEQIVALAASDPQSLGLPFSRWSEALLQKEVVNRKIVAYISKAQIGRFLKRSPHQTAP